MCCVSPSPKKIAASDYEASYARLEGVEFLYNKKPVEITDKGVVLRDLDEAEDGTLTERPGTEMLYPADSVVVSISQGPTMTIAENEKKIETNARGLFVTDEVGCTTMPGVFASGDAVKGARTVVEAVAYSKRWPRPCTSTCRPCPPTRRTSTPTCRWPSWRTGTDTARRESGSKNKGDRFAKTGLLQRSAHKETLPQDLTKTGRWLRCHRPVFGF